MLVRTMRRRQSLSLTENGASAFNTSGNDLVDLFALAGAMRGRSESEISSMYIRALNVNEELAVKLAFYTRDVRGGLGERRVGRIMLKTLASVRPAVVRENLNLIPEYGRWDDLMVLMDTPVENDVVELIRNVLESDVLSMNSGGNVTLLAKWLPSVNASSFAVRNRAMRLCNLLGMPFGEYRRTLSSLRSYINVTEVRLSSKDYGKIAYPAVPSLAMMRYRNAFFRNDGERFGAYLAAVKEGTAQIHAGTLYPYDIVEKYMWYDSKMDEVLEEQWKALPEYAVDGSFLVMADVSGSMYGRPMATSVGLAIYFAERCKGPFENCFMTFSSRPRLVEVKGQSLYEKIQGVMAADWQMNTNLQAAFQLVLDSAVECGLSASDMPKTIVVISDMEIDYCTDARDWGF